MAKSRSFSIYLLKDEFDPFNTLKEDHPLELIDEDENTNLPEDAIMYISDRAAHDPWWKAYWGINKNLNQVQKGALVFLKAGNRWIALTFGSTYHQLKDNSYEYDFGIKTTLNALDPKKIKSTDILLPENAKRQRVQSPTASELNFFELRSDETILKRMTGAVKREYTDLFKNITGGNSLRISSKVQAEEITGLCEQLIDIYSNDDFKVSFPELRSIVPIKDPETIGKLNNKLIEAFNQEPAPFELVLTIPDLFDYDKDYVIKYTGAGRSNLEFSEVYIDEYRIYLQERQLDEIDDIATFKQHKMRFVDENDLVVTEYSIYRSFLFDCELDNDTYHLCEGEWYHIAKDYITKLENELNPLFIDDHQYLHQCEHRREDDYNRSISEEHELVINLDKKNISPAGQRQVEPCDLIYLKKDSLELIHIKVSTRSAGLSHLFNQGLNAVELLRMDGTAKDNLKNLLPENEEMHSLVDVGNYSILYGIITKNDRDKKSKSLPIFSRISLLRTINALKLMNIPVTVYLIYDNVERKKNQE